jgi:hypothetical protein
MYLDETTPRPVGLAKDRDNAPRYFIDVETRRTSSPHPKRLQLHQTAWVSL